MSSGENTASYPPGDHRAKHPSLDVENCYACRIRSVQLGLGDLSPEIADVSRREKQLRKDLDSYKRLRHDGLQPSSVDGSERLESKVKDQVEIDWKIPIPEKDLPRVKEIQYEVAASKYGVSLPK